MNLLTETLEAIKRSGHKVADITFIGSEETGHRCTWPEFERMADREYGSGLGDAMVATDLIVVFSDGQKLWRGEDDGSEWWEYSTPFSAPTESHPIKRLIGAYWPSLKDLQDDTDKHHNPESEYG